VTKSNRDHGTKHCDDFNKTVTFILDVTKETGFPLSYILAYKRCVKIFCKKMWADIGRTVDWSSQQCTLRHLELHHTAQEGTWVEIGLSCLREVREFGKTEAIALNHLCLFHLLPDLIIDTL
jgi:hypothetical protein